MQAEGRPAIGRLGHGNPSDVPSARRTFDVRDVVRSPAAVGVCRYNDGVVGDDIEIEI